MTRRHTSNDVFAAAVPPNINPDDDNQREQLLTYLDGVARDWVWKQWPTGERPVEIEFAASEWLITSDPDKVELFQPAHDCAACRAGNDQCMAYLKANPGAWVAMANMTYVEVWPS